MYINPRELHTIQWEPTSLCNANCIGCPRTDHDTMLTHPFIVKSQRHASDTEIQGFVDSVADQRLEKLSRIIFNGEIGDAMMHPQIHKIIIDILKARPNISIDIHTNGGGPWWDKIESICEYASGHNSKVHFTFSIDGLEDTNHLYRRNVQWKNIVKNTKVVSNYNSIGAVWRWCTFDHNKHQIEEAREMAKEWNLFFETNKNVWGQKQVSKYIDKKSDTKLYKEKLKNFSLTFEDIKPDDVIKKGSSNCSDVCIWQASKSIQIASDMSVWPCCWTAHFQYYYMQRNQNIWSKQRKTSPELRDDMVLSDLKEWEELLNSEEESYYDKKDISISKNFLLHDVLAGDTFTSIGKLLKTDNSFNLSICVNECRQPARAHVQ